jgi:hypothetical protein
MPKFAVKQVQRQCIHASCSCCAAAASMCSCWCLTGLWLLLLLLLCWPAISRPAPTLIIAMRCTRVTATTKP